MAKKRRKFLKIVLIVVIILAVGGFLANWFLTYRLEKLLREELSERVYDATDGFYRLNFDKLSVGLFSGELTVNGVFFKPDSTVFNKWSASDSLPSTYFDVYIGMIHFKGLNLTWRFSYKELNFDLFEIREPIINIYESNNSRSVDDIAKNVDSETPYEMISEYINVLTVKEINLENANISYFTSYEDNPSLYALKNVSFHAYNFRLDENSYDSGKLLYSDNFDFNTHEPQILLSNNQFTLNIDAIKLSTKDSLININGIGLIPQKMLWAQTNQIPESYVEANVDSVMFEGLSFKRENARNFFEARSFNIMTSDILYFDTKVDSIVSDEKLQGRLTPKETVGLSWSLYAIVSPIFKSIVVDNIGILNAKLAYSLKTKDKTDLYKLSNFNFEAYNFRIDSLADIQRKFLYSDGFEVDATSIDATVATRNYILNIGKMFMNTLQGAFNIKEVKLWPISTKTDLDYIQGSIDSLSIAGIVYDQGLDIDDIQINSPVLEYVKMPSKIRHHIRKERTDTIIESTIPISIVSSYFKFLSIRNLDLNNGNLVFNDRQNPKNSMTYKVPKIDFHASNVLVNEETISKSSSYVTYDNFDFRFENFDNILPGKEYRLLIKKGYYTGWGGNLRLNNIKLVPQESSWKKSPEVYVSLTTPIVDIRGVNYDNVKGVDFLKFGSVNINNPQIKIVRTSHPDRKDILNDRHNNNMRIDLGNLRVTKAYVKYENRVDKDNLDFSVDNLALKSFIWDSDDKLWVDEVLLQTPNIQFKKTQGNKILARENHPHRRPLSKDLHINRIDIQDLTMGLDRPEMKLNGNVKSLGVKKMNKSKDLFSIADVEIQSPLLKIDQIINSENINKESPDSINSKNLYVMLQGFANNFSVDRFKVADAEIDYKSTLNGRSAKHQQINSTSFDFTGFTLNAEKRDFNLQDFNFTTKNFHLPLDNGFYTLGIGQLDIHKKDETLKLNQIHLISAYPKEEFAYHHPKHSDWFDVSVGNVVLAGIDYPTFFADKVLNIRDVSVGDVKLLNYKNQNIDIEHNVMPLIYVGLQKAPLKMNIQNLDVSNFMVSYQELSRGATEPGEIFFTEMNGKFEGFTNIVTKPQQYIKLDANGKLMGTGYFTAKWYLPVDSLNDRFLLTGKLNQFELIQLNRLITPMAPLEVKDGRVNSLVFKTEASSKGARVQMRFLYDDLSVSVLKNTENGTAPNKLYSTLANAVLKKNNPNKAKDKPREPNLSIVRDPYHSTFNYIWQILQPPVVESVGISQGKQNFMKDVAGFISKVKNFFKREKKKDSLDADDKEE